MNLESLERGSESAGRKLISLIGFFVFTVLVTGTLVQVRDGFGYTELPNVPEPRSWDKLGPTAPFPPEDGPRPGRPAMNGLGWQVIDYVAVHGVLVVNVETGRSGDLNNLARELINPLKEDYTEILVYFHRSGDTLAHLRVQWTDRGLYQELDMSGQ